MASIKVIVAVKDLAAQAFGTPFVVPSSGVGMRSFKDEVNRKADDNQIATHPEDFELYEIGSFDDTSGVITPKVALIARAKDLTDAPS